MLKFHFLWESLVRAQSDYRINKGTTTGKARTVAANLVTMARYFISRIMKLNFVQCVV